MRVLAVDPGREKCGVAVCDPGVVVARRVVALDDLRGLSNEWVKAYGVDMVIVGNQTGYKRVFDIMKELSVPVEPVPERGSTLAGRRRYFRDHPPRSWRKLIPLSLQIPSEPYDDYSAVVLAEAYLAGHPNGRPAPAEP